MPNKKYGGVVMARGAGKKFVIALTSYPYSVKMWPFPGPAWLLRRLLAKESKNEDKEYFL